MKKYINAFNPYFLIKFVNRKVLKMDNQNSNITLEQFLIIRQDQYLEARMNYELVLREFSLVNVNKCPSCFEEFFTTKKGEIEADYLSGKTKPNLIEVLELMAMTPVIHEH